MIQGEISSSNKDKKIESLERQELILKDLRINVECRFPMNKPQKRVMETSKGTQIMGFLIDSDEGCSIKSEDGEILVGGESSIEIDPFKSDTTNIFMSNRNLEIIYHFYDSLVVARIEFSPFDPNQIINRTIKDLEAYNCFYFQFNKILKRFPSRPKENISISYKILINGKLFKEITHNFKAKLQLKGEGEFMILFDIDGSGLFYDAENRYLKQTASN